MMRKALGVIALAVLPWWVALPAEASADTLVCTITVDAAGEAWANDCDLYAFEVGDDNADGIILEDESGWDCATMGNKICGGIN